MKSGTKLAHYEILSPLGKGGMGVVYKAQDTRLKRRVAIKLLPPETTRDETAKQRFLQEAQAASALDHPNICTIYEINETDDGQLYLAMAYYEGETVKQKIERGPLLIDESIRIAIQVAEGLGKAHDVGIVHRDIKPANLIVTVDGTVRILDFGLAKLAGSEGMTETGATVGTVAYMSPEQARGQGVDQRTDIWSLGVVLYEMVTGSNPFQGENLLAISKAILENQPLAVTETRADVPAALVQIIDQALTKDRGERFQSTGELLSQLRGNRILASSPDAKRIPSIAVLPFSNLSTDPEQEYFCDGMAEDVINALDRIKGVRVVARTSAFAFKGKHQDAREIGKTLNVDTLLEGSVRKAGRRIRITIQLINIADGYQLWSERFDRDLKDVFAIQDEISLAIVDKLEVQLLGGERAALVKRPTDDIELYNLCLLGRHHWNRFTPEDTKKSQEYFEKAITLDSTYAPAYAGLANFYISSGGGGVDILPAKVALPKAKAAAEKALSIDANCGEAHFALGLASIFFEQNWPVAKYHGLRAIECDPNFSPFRQVYAFYLSAVGRHDEALKEINRAVEMDPCSALALENAAFHYYLARRYEEALDYCARSLALVPDFAWTHLVAGMIHIQQGMLDKAVSGIEPLRSFGFYSEGYLGCACGLSGREDRARQILLSLQALVETGERSAFSLALVHLGLGQHMEALEFLEHAQRERPAFILAAWAKADPIWDPVRPDPRFQDVVRKMNLAD